MLSELHVHRFLFFSPQRMQNKTSELNRLRAALAESERKEVQLKSNVVALGSRVSALDRELRYGAIVA